MSSQKIAALYPRTSQEKDDAFSISSQVAEMLEYAKECNFVIPDTYILSEDHTGKVLDRPELNKVRRLMRRGEIDVLIVYDATRLARKIGVADILLDEIFEYGIELHLVSWGCAVKDTTRDRKTFYDESVYADIERRKSLNAPRAARPRK